MFTVQPITDFADPRLAPFRTLKKQFDHWNEGFFVAAQNCHHRSSGAFTGEVAAPMLKSMSFLRLSCALRRGLGRTATLGALGAVVGTLGATAACDRLGPAAGLAAVSFAPPAPGG